MHLDIVRASRQIHDVSYLKCSIAKNQFNFDYQYPNIDDYEIEYNLK